MDIHPSGAVLGTEIELQAPSSTHNLVDLTASLPSHASQLHTHHPSRSAGSIPVRSVLGIIDGSAVRH